MRRLHVVDLNALFALGREAELVLGLEPVRLGEGPQEDLAVADGDGALVGRAVPGLAAIERIADRSPGGDEELDAAFAAVLRELVAQDELVGPGHRIAGLVLARRINDQEVHAQRRRGVVLILKLRARVADRGVFGVEDAGRRAGVLRIDA